MSGMRRGIGRAPKDELSSTRCSWKINGIGEKDSKTNGTHVTSSEMPLLWQGIENLEYTQFKSRFLEKIWRVCKDEIIMNKKAYQDIMIYCPQQEMWCGGEPIAGTNN